MALKRRNPYSVKGRDFLGAVVFLFCIVGHELLCDVIIFLCGAHISAFSLVCKTDVIKIVNLYTLFLKVLYFYLK